MARSMVNIRIMYTTVWLGYCLRLCANISAYTHVILCKLMSKLHWCEPSVPASVSVTFNCHWSALLA